MSTRGKTAVLALFAAFAFSAVASASASAFNLEWEVNGTKLVSGTVSVKGTGTTAFILNEGKTTEVRCTTQSAEGTITGGKPGTDEATKIVFSGCTTREAACKVADAGKKTAGTIEVKNVPTKLEERKKGGAAVLADNFAQNATTKEFVTLEFTGTCAAYPATTKVKGAIAAQVSGEQLVFPTSGEGFVEGGTLEAFGTKATLSGKSTQKGLSGEKITAS